MMGRRYFSHFTIVKNWPLIWAHQILAHFLVLPTSYVKKIWVYHECHTPTNLIAKIVGRKKHIIILRMTFVPVEIFGDIGDPSYA
jgi:hypothetical protein